MVFVVLIMVVFLLHYQTLAYSFFLSYYSYYSLRYQMILPELSEISWDYQQLYCC